MSSISFIPYPTRVNGGMEFGVNKDQHGEKFTEAFSPKMNFTQDIVSIRNKSEKLEGTAAFEAGGGIVGIMFKEFPDKYSLRTGGALGLQLNNFNEDNSVRFETIGGYDFGRKSAYTGGRITYAVYNEGAPIGLYGQLERDLSGTEKGTRFQAGLTVGLWINKKNPFYY